MFDLLIQNGTVVTSQSTTRAHIGVQSGRIAALMSGDVNVEARDIVDASGLHILPGVIDTHTHLRDPSKAEREDWATGTMAAAAGGITMLWEMPISSPSVSSAESLAQRVSIVQPKSYVDFALYGGAGADNLDDLQGQADAGAIAFKTFRTRMPAGRESEFRGLCAPDPADYFRVLQRAAQTGLIATVHAEDPYLLARLTDELKHAGNNGPRSHSLVGAPIVEEASVAQCIALARAANARLHIVHCSSAYSIDLVTQARQSGVAVTCETCPPYLFLNEDALDQHGPFAKINPALRPQAMVEQLWQRVKSGAVDFICTDHAPFLPEEKQLFWDDMWRAAPGAPGLEAFVPMMLTAVNDGKLSLQQMVQLTSENAARIFGLYPRKGAIQIGSDADLTLVDLQRAGVINIEQWHTRAKRSATIWDGMRTVGAPVMTIVRGKLVAHENKIVGDAGWGTFVAPRR